MTNVKLFYSFYKTLDGKSLACLSTYHSTLLKYLEKTTSPVIIQSLEVNLDDFKLLSGIKNNFSDNKFYIAENIENKEDLKIWILVNSGKFECEEEWFEFLKEHNLVKDWINGSLIYTIGHYYHESSKDFGPRHKYDEVQAKLVNIWDFKEYFNGIRTTKHGYYYQYWYEDITKIIKVENKDKAFKINCDWVNSLKCGYEPIEIDLKFVKAGCFEI